MPGRRSPPRVFEVVWLPPIVRAPGNNALRGGLKVVAESGWFAVRPSGTEDVYKLYVECFRGSGFGPRHRISSRRPSLLLRRSGPRPGLRHRVVFAPPVFLFPMAQDPCVAITRRQRLHRPVAYRTAAVYAGAGRARLHSPRPTQHSTMPDSLWVNGGGVVKVSWPFLPQDGGWSAVLSTAAPSTEPWSRLQPPASVAR